jgi:hypothetical protein
MTQRRAESSSKGMLDTLSEAAAGPLANLVAGPPTFDEHLLHGPSFTRFDALVWSLHRIARNAIGPEVEREALTRLSGAPRWTHAAQEAFVAWIELVEGLVQSAEARHPGAGAGEAKADEVRKAVAALRAPSAAPATPETAPSDARDEFLEWTIDGLVLLLDSYSLWSVPDTGPGDARPSRAGLARRVVRRVMAIPARTVRGVANGVGWLAGRLERAAGRPPAPPAAPRGGERVVWAERELAALRGSARWFGAHRHELVGALELVFSAVQLAALRRDFDPVKREAYATDLVVTALEEMGLEEGLGPIFGVVDFFVRWPVAAATRIFEKHGAIPAPPPPRPRPRRAALPRGPHDEARRRR